MDRMSETSPEMRGPVLPKSLRDRLGALCRTRCLSSRDHREVHLVEDSRGDRRIFKVCRQRDPDSLVRFQRVREMLKGVDAGGGLMPILDYGLEPVHGLSWEELPLADPLDPGEVPFENYSPVILSTRLSGSVIGATRIGLSVVAALEFLHGRGFAHGDVKPANLFQFQGRWVLGDYDTVGELQDEQRITASTEGYCPPGGAGAPDRDLYALGKLIYEVWSGNTRLEYPSIPDRLSAAGTWSREDRLINRLIENLCHPVGINRLRQIGTVRSVLEAIASADAAELSRAEGLLQPRGRRPLKTALTVMVSAGLLGMVLTQSGWLPALPLIPSLMALVSGAPGFEPTAGLVAYYPLDGDSRDHSGRGHHGTSFGVSWSIDASKAVAKAAHFNGESGISIPEFPESETNAYSLVLWAKASELKHQGKLILKDRAVGDRDSPGRQWAVGWNHGMIDGGLWVSLQGTTNQYRDVKISFQLPVGRWIHVVQTWDGRVLEHWIDGRRVESLPAFGSLASGDAPIRIGWDQYYFFKGDIDEVRLYDRALSGDEVRGMHRLGLRRAFRDWWTRLGKH